MTGTIDNNDDLIDSCDVIARIEELESERADLVSEAEDDTNAAVDESRELVSDIGDMPREIPPYIEIDWEATAENIRADYMSVDFDGVTYYVR